MNSKATIPTRKTISRVKYLILLLFAIFLLSQVLWQDNHTEIERTTEILQQVNFETNVTKSPGSEALEIDSSINSTAGPKTGILTKLQRRAKACSFYDPLINRSSPVLCGAKNFVSIVWSGCKKRLGNQLSSYAVVLYFQKKVRHDPSHGPLPDEDHKVCV